MRKKIESRQRVIEAHEEKIRLERMKAHPDEDLIAGWLAEIDSHKKAIERLNRRLRREWQT